MKLAKRIALIALAAFAYCTIVGMLVLPSITEYSSPDDCEVVKYDAQNYPGIDCLANRVVVETATGLDTSQRAELWQQYGLAPSFEWINEKSGFTYHELEVTSWNVFDYAAAVVQGKQLYPRELSKLIPLVDEDPRVNWACPDVLALEWAEGSGGDSYGASLLGGRYRQYDGTLIEWLAEEETQDPLPDFEFYRECAPDGTPAPWALELRANEAFMENYGMLFGTNQAQALREYEASGSPELSPVTICIADTGVMFNHPDLAGRMHPNSLDGNYRNFQIAPADGRPGIDVEITDRYDENAVGLPRLAVKGRPASHGTCVAGIVERCTDGFNTTTGPIRLLPASIKSQKAVVFTGYKIKSPISSFIKLIAALNEKFPVGDFTPDADDEIQNTGDVRVVSISASVPKSMFSETEWKVVANLIGKAAGSIQEDINDNDRLYLFAAGNEAQGEANKPGEMDYVLAVSATSAYDGSLAWEVPLSGEGSNLAAACVSAPGYGIITSIAYESPNLAFLPENEFAKPRENWSIPPRKMTWQQQTNRFSATSSATPQVSALAALLYAQEPVRDYGTVIQLIQHSTSGRRNRAEWGESLGIVDYSRALRFEWEVIEPADQ